MIWCVHEFIRLPELFPSHTHICNKQRSVCVLGAFMWRKWVRNWVSEINQKERHRECGFSAFSFCDCVVSIIIINRVQTACERIQWPFAIKPMVDPYIQISFVRWIYVFRVVSWWTTKICLLNFREFISIWLGISWIFYSYTVTHGVGLSVRPASYALHSTECGAHMFQLKSIKILVFSAVFFFSSFL